MRSVRNIRQITKAMELIAVTRLRRAQQRVMGARPYAAKMGEIIAEIAAHTGPTDENGLPSHELLARRPVSRVGVILITSDRGLCGALNGNTVRAALQFSSREIADGHQIEFVSVGRKGIMGLRHTPHQVVADFQGIGDYPAMGKTVGIARVAAQAFERGDVDQVVIVFSKFVSTLRQEPTVLPLLPIDPAPFRHASMDHPPSGGVDDQGDFLFEPDPHELLANILPRFVEVQVYQTILESIASEFSARMVAMRNATDNATDLIKSLQLGYNKARQSTITREIIEVSSGAAALGN